MLFSGFKHTSACKSVDRVAFFILAFVVLATSCVGLQKNYLGKSKRQNLLAPISNGQIEAREAQRKEVTHRTDSVLQRIVFKKKTENHLMANDLNQIYYNFGMQVDNDRFFNYLLHRGGLRRDSLTSLQKYGASKLLLAAIEYERQYQPDKTLRRALNAGDAANNIPRKVIRKSRNYLYSPKVRRRLTQSRNNGAYPSDSILEQLPKTNIFKAAFYSIYQHNDRLHSALHDAFSFLGKTFFSSKPNKIIRRSQRENAEKLLSQLRPGDIVLSKSAGYLTNQVIPGYFTHASIWLDVKNRRRYPVNAEKLSRESKREVTINDRSMAESTTIGGVHISSLRDFAHAQTYLILRPKQLDSNQKMEVMSNILKQMKKGYDFNFDIESSDLINCTELVFLAYDFIDWDTHYFMGKYTIFPDDILQTALHNNMFEIAALLDNGKLVQYPDTKAVLSLIGQ